MITNVM